MGTAKVNIHPLERDIFMMLGCGLLLRSVRRNSLGGSALAIALLYRGISGHSYFYQVLGMNTNKQRENETSDGAIEVERSITVEKPAIELYLFWHEPKNLSQIMTDFVEITPISENRTHWRVRAPLVQLIGWDAQIVEDHLGEVDLGGRGPPEDAAAGAGRAAGVGARAGPAADRGLPGHHHVVRVEIERDDPRRHHRPQHRDHGPVFRQDTVLQEIIEGSDLH